MNKIVENILKLFDNPYFRITAVGVYIGFYAYAIYVKSLEKQENST